MTWFTYRHICSIQRWKPTSDSNDTYILLFTELFRGVLRQLRGHKFDLDFPLTESQTSNALKLVDVLLNSGSSPEEQVAALQNFVWSLVVERRTDPWSNIFQFFFALMALRVDGTYACAANLSPDLAKMKYLVKLTCMAETLRQPEDEQIRCDMIYPLRSIYQTSDKALVSFEVFTIPCSPRVSMG